VLGVIFVLIVSFMPEGLIPGSIRLARRLGQALRGRSGASAGSPAVNLAATAEQRRGGTP